MEKRKYNKHKLNRKEDIQKVNNYIYQINYESKRKNINKKEKWLKENSQIK